MTQQERRTSQRVLQKSSFQSWLLLADSSKQRFSAKILDRSMKGYKVLVCGLSIPAQQMLQITKENIDGHLVKINTIVVWSKELVINGKLHTELGLKL